MRILISKRTDGSSVLKCIRADGSETWQKNQGATAAFFPLHDITHYVVETELGFTNAFYGLIAQGLTIDETGPKRSERILPDEALIVENIVGTLDSERAGNVRWTAHEFNESLALKATNDGRPIPRPLMEEEILRIRTRRAELFQTWRDLPAGETLELEFRFFTSKP